MDLIQFGFCCLEYENTLKILCVCLPAVPRRWAVWSDKERLRVQRPGLPGSDLLPGKTAPLHTCSASHYSSSSLMPAAKGRSGFACVGRRGWGLFAKHLTQLQVFIKLSESNHWIYNRLTFGDFANIRQKKKKLQLINRYSIELNLVW